MKYQIYAKRTKGDFINKRVLVATSTTPYTPDRLTDLKTRLTMRSLEFDDSVKLENEIEKEVV